MYYNQYMGNPRTQNLILTIVGAGLLLISLVMPVGHWVERIVFLEDACWSFSWLLIAAVAFREERTGFPVAALPITFAVEFYLFCHYTLIEDWPYNRWLLINYVLWPVCTCFNLLAAYRFTPGEKKVFILKTAGETAFYFLIFFFLAKNVPSESVMLYFGQTVIAMISLQFVWMILQRPDALGISLTGNVFRFAGGLLCYVLNSSIRVPDTYLRIIMPAVVALDVVFLILLIRKKKAT